MPLCYSITHQAIVLESCSNPQKSRQVFESAMTKNCGFYVSDIISEVGFWPHWLVLPGLRSNH